MGQGEHREVLETFRLFAHDRGWLRRLREAVSTGLTAEAAVERVQNDARARLHRQTDPFMRERWHDPRRIGEPAAASIDRGAVSSLRTKTCPTMRSLSPRAMGPAALLEYDRTKLRGLILEDGGALSHVAIVARAIGIPVVSDIANIIDFVEQGDAIIIDGGTGDVHVRPSADVENSYAEKARLRASRQAQYHKLRDLPATTKDGVTIELHMNAGLIIDLQHVAETGATSIGLFRTEIQFMVASQFPRMSEQILLYRAVFDALPDRPVTFRTLDIGSDKVLPLYGQGRRGKSGARLARDPLGAGSAGPVALAIARHAACRCRACPAHHVPDDRDGR